MDMIYRIMLFLVCISLIINPVLGQSKLVDSKLFSDFFEYITRDGGEWKANNPNCQLTDKNGLKEFVVNFSAIDPLMINAEIIAVTVNKDTLNLWDVTEFYAPFNKKAFIVQRSGDGEIYAYGESELTVSGVRNSLMEFFHPNGLSQMNKDTHQIIDEDLMQSTSYYQDENNEWIRFTTLDWKRQH